MAFDLEYIMTACDHRIHDEFIAEASSESVNMITDTSRFGLANFGIGRFGRNVYAYIDRYGAAGTYIENTDGTVTAIFPIPGNIASNPQLFAKLPSDYLRQPLPRYSRTENQTTLYFGDELYYGEDDVVTYGGSGTVPSATVQELWTIAYEPTAIGTTPVPANSLIVHRYDNKYELYLDYNIQTSECPFCSGSLVRNDIRLTPIGRLAAVFDIDKLAQQIMKAIMTLKSKNPFFPAYGTILSEMIGEKTMSGFVVREQIVYQLSEIKRIQEQILAQNTGFFSARELLEDIVGIKVTPQEDPRAFGLTISILNRALEQYTSKTIRIS